jgi:hypothetical protein
VLILDEPTSGLDPLQRIELRELVRELAAEHTVLFSSHILPEVEAVCPRVLIIHRGVLVADGTPEELVRQLGGAAHVRVEAVVGHDVAAARVLLASLPGVAEVIDQGRLGIHHGFDLGCTEDVREDVGALAAQRGWALRELSFQRPALEEIFARIALDLDDGAQRAEAPASAPIESAAPQATPAVLIQSPGLRMMGDAPTTPAAPATPEAPAEKPPAKVLNPFGEPPKKKEVYNLNPFEGGKEGAPRDLSKPKKTEDTE